MTCCLSFVAPTREEVEMLLPPLEPQYCVEQAMNAILIDQPLVCIPRLIYLPFLSRAEEQSHSCMSTRDRLQVLAADVQYFLFLFRLLPWESNVVTYRFMGSDKCMLPFIERKKKHMANGPVKVV